MMLALYLGVTALALVSLSAMIMAVARALASCPEEAARARAAGVAIATGYLAIGGGAVLMIGTLVAMQPAGGLGLFAMGLAVLILGLGFAEAIKTLQAAVRPAEGRKAQPAPVPAEPALP